MADLSGVCDSHGIIIFCGGDSAHNDDPLPVNEDKWYWATCQHLVLTGKPNGPHVSRTAALADAVVMMSAHDSNTVLAGSDLG